MAEIERTEHGDSGRARAWTLRAVRALHDPAWTADGYVTDRWRPVSPVTGRLDAFQWQTPVAALPSDKGAAIESSAFEEAMLATPRRAVVLEPPKEPPRDVTEPAAEPVAPRSTGADRRAGQCAAAGCCRRGGPRRGSPPRGSTAAEPRHARAQAGRTGAKPAGPPVPLAAGYSEGRSDPDSGRHSADPGARRSRGRRRRPGGRIRGTNRPAQGPGRRLAGIFVTLGRQLGLSQRFSCQSGPCPISGAGVSGSRRTLRSVRRNSSVGRARHS